MAKGTSFAEKARRGLKKGKEFNVVKYVKSVLSEKTGHYRFQETILKVPTGMNLDAYLKQMEKESTVVEEPKVDEAQPVEEKTAEKAVETAEASEKEQVVEEVIEEKQPS